MERSFDPSDFDRRLDALMHIAESQSKSIHELSETVRQQGLQIAKQTVQMLEHGRQIDRQIDAIIGLAKQGDDHADRIAELERWREQRNPEN